MPRNSKIANSARTDQQLSELIKLKRLERPSEAFWNDFEQEFRSRQLSTFVRVQPIQARLLRVSKLIARKAGPPAVAAGAVALTVFAITNTVYLTNNAKDAAPANQSEPHPVNPPAASYFAMKTESPAAESQNGNANESAGTVYQVNHLQLQASGEPNYRLLATPVTFSNGMPDQSIGAKVISAKPRY